MIEKPEEEIQEPEFPNMHLHHWINYKSEFIQYMPVEQYIQRFIQHFNQWFNFNYNQNESIH